VKITADTNVLLRAYLSDDEAQTRAAIDVLETADAVSVTLPCLCEFVWVLARRYKIAPDDIAAAIGTLLDTSNVIVDRPAVASGLAMLKAGGDFADGVIAHEGRRLGGETFVSFDRAAVELLMARGVPSRLIA
jgi:predicted nucleic-acid-binding protein